ncbi:molybdopterin converting factor subunit 1 [Azovibrio restrictus]|uniref:molybdopterin converting factor subunit 1 n=1 Tax=Azovibrio restrictus TaxID=146938 RepID=UPI0026EEFA96|nr:molybdopterin converting factor subunit 1 [Azovibrio restrictus]
MSVRILYFASLRERLGRGEESLELPEGLATVGELKDWLAGQGREALGQTPNLRFAVNQEMARASDPVLDGDEVAFFPPVTGG